jgi:hypothetical protein
MKCNKCKDEVICGKAWEQRRVCELNKCKDEVECEITIYCMALSNRKYYNFEPERLGADYTCGFGYESVYDSVYDLLPKVSSKFIFDLFLWKV